MPVPEAERSKAWVCGRLLAGITSLNPAGGCMPVSYECCVRSLLGADSPTYCGVSDCD
jgi:hypothetical protein